jgi:hypothetical protein
VFTALAVTAAAVLTAVVLWPDDGGVSPMLGDVTWSRVSDVPSDQIYAVTATPEGFLAASPVSDGGVDFWTSEDGESWELLVSDQAAFGAYEAVAGLTWGEAGLVAEVEPLPPLSRDALDPSTVWTSPDGETWHRSEVTVAIDVPDSPYLRTETWIEKVVVGPGAFVARGGSMVQLDLGAILAEVRPDLSTEDVIGFGVLGPTEWTLQIDTMSEEISVSLADLGLTQGEMELAVSEIVVPHLWWSADGVSWESIDQPAGVPVSPEFSATVGTTDGFYLFFASPQIGFESADGRTWEPFEMEGLPDPFGGGIVVTIEDGFLASGGTTVHGWFGGGPGEQSVWTSSDGRRWSRAAVELPAGLGPELSFEVHQVASGPLGILARGNPMRPYYEPEVVIFQDEFALTLGSRFWTLADRATGDVLAEIDMESMSGGSVVVTEEEGTLTFTNRETSEVLLVVAPEDIWMAEEEARAAVGSSSPVVVKDGYTVTMSGDTWILADADTGEAIASYQGPEVMATEEGGDVTLTDPETGVVLLTVTEADIEAAFTEMEAATSGTAPEDIEGMPAEFLSFSSDAETWDVGAVTDLFGEGTTILGRMAVGTDRAVVLVVSDSEAWMEYVYGEGEVEPPPVELWIGEIAS